MSKAFTATSRFQMIIIFFFNDTATTEIYTLSLHDALTIFSTNYPRMQTVLRTPAIWLHSESLAIADARPHQFGRVGESGRRSGKRGVGPFSMAASVDQHGWPHVSPAKTVLSIRVLYSRLTTGSC